MKKLIALIMAALLALSAVAFAETYHTGDVVFDYDEKVFDISLDDSTDDVTNSPGAHSTTDRVLYISY